jgi:hypothetical protein
MTNTIVQYYLGTYLSNNGQEYQNVILKLSSGKRNPVDKAMQTFSYYFDTKKYIIDVQCKLSLYEYEMLKNHLTIYDHGKIPNKKIDKRRESKSYI